MGAAQYARLVREGTVWEECLDVKTLVDSSYEQQLMESLAKLEHIYLYKQARWWFASPLHLTKASL